MNPNSEALVLVTVVDATMLPNLDRRRPGRAGRGRGPARRHRRADHGADHDGGLAHRFGPGGDGVMTPPAKNKRPTRAPRRPTTPPITGPLPRRPTLEERIEKKGVM